MKHVSTCFAFNLQFAKSLLNDVPQEKMCQQIGGLTNHPAWLIGHLAYACDSFAKLLGVEPICPPDWAGLFRNGSQPMPDASKYPDKATLLAKLEEGHRRLAKAVADTPESQFNKPNPIKELAAALPTLGDMLVFAMVGHEATHLGQLSAWRRAQGLPSVF